MKIRIQQVVNVVSHICMSEICIHVCPAFISPLIGHYDIAEWGHLHDLVLICFTKLMSGTLKSNLSFPFSNSYALQ